MNILSRISNFKQSISQRKPRFDDHYELGKTLGAGSFATVYACTKKDAECSEIAVKVFDRTAKKGLRREFRGECKLLSMVTANEYTVHMLDSFESRSFCHIVMEKCGISIQEAFIKCEARNVNELDLAHLFKCMLKGVRHLHECGIVHRDIKPANLLLAAGSSSNLSSRPLVKICDLGLAATLPAKGGLTEVCGTAPYMAPEMLIPKKTYNEGADIWSCGVTAYLMLFGKYPYKDRCYNSAEVKECIREGKTLPTFRTCRGLPQPSETATKFVASLLQREPDLRPDASRALKAPYIKQLDPRLSLPSSSSLPSFGPTLSLVHDLTRDEPAAETPAAGRDLEDSNEDETSDSTNEGLSRASTGELSGTTSL